MRKNIHTVLVMMFLLGTSDLTLSQQYTTFGSPDCGQWLADKNQSRIGWILGFMSGQNIMWVRWNRNTVNAKDVFDPLKTVNSAEQIYAWMDNYCRANPLKNLADGGSALFTELLTR